MDLVAPIVPDAQKNRSPDIFLEGMRGGLAAMAQFAELRRRSESDIAHMALQERMANKEHEVQARKMAQDYELHDRDLSIKEELLPYHKSLMDSQSDLMTERAKAYADGTATAAQRSIKFNKQMESLMEDFNAQAEKRGLLDPKFAAKDPAGFAEAMLNQRDEFGMASWVPQIKNGLTQFQRIADQQKVLYGTDKKPRPVWQILQNLTSDDAEVKKKTIEDLKAAGHMKEQKVPGKPTKSWTRPIDTMWDKFIGPADTTEEVPDETLGTLQERASQFQRVPSRVPPTMLPKTYSTGTEPTAMPDVQTEDGELPPQSSNAMPEFPPTETDKLLESALKAIQRGAPPKAVATRLRENGVDPSLLWAT